MPITFLNGTLVTSGSAVVDCQAHETIYLHVGYTKGSETLMTFAFSTQNPNHPSASLALSAAAVSASFFNVTEKVVGSAPLSLFTASISATGQYTIAVPVPMSSHVLKTSITPTGSFSGTAEILFAGDKQYW